MNFAHLATLIFDCDGLLVDSEPLQFEARRRAAAKFGHDLSEEDFLYYWFEGNGGTDVFCARYKLPVAEFQRSKHEVYDQFIDEQLALCAGVAEFLKAVKGRFKLALCSNSGIRDIERILAKFDLKNYFDEIVSGNDLHHGKPDPEGFLLAAKRTSARPSEALVFENSHIGLFAAKAAGMACVIVPDEYGAKYQFGAADAQVKRIDEALAFLT